MAVIPEVPGLEVFVQVDNLPLCEYPDDTTRPPSPDSVSKYIETVSGAEFSVVLNVANSDFPYDTEDLEICLTFDGGRRDLFVLGVAQRVADPEHVFRSHMSNTAQGHVKQNYVFSELQVHEGASDGSLPLGRLAGLGSIVVELHCFRYGDLRNYNHDTTDLAKPLLADGRVAEKDLKGDAVSHQAGLGAPEPVTADDGSICPREVIRTSENPVATFTFKYRSHTALQTLGIIPRSPLPVPLEDRPVVSLTLEEARELIVRQKNYQATHEMRNPGLKQEIKNEGQSSGGVKRELDPDDDDVQVILSQPAKRRKALPGVGDEVVDLSD